MCETKFFGSIDNLKKVSTVLTYYYSNVKAHAIKKLERCPKSGTNICDLDKKKRRFFIRR